MSDEPCWTMTNDSVIVVLDGNPHTIKSGDPNFEATKEAVWNKQWDAVKTLICKGLALEEWARGRFEFRDNYVWYDGDKIPNELNARMVKMAACGDSPEFLFKFWEKLKLNPSHRSVTQLFSFLTHVGIPIDEDGDLLAYKSVNRDFTDHYSGSHDNSVGAVREMDRNKISDDPDEACAEGYHVGALNYAQNFSYNSRIVICKLSPADVVCVPKDSSQQKVRVCKYEVVGHYGDVLPDTTYDTTVDDDVDAGIPTLVLPVFFHNLDPDQALEVARALDVDCGGTTAELLDRISGVIVRGDYDYFVEADAKIALYDDYYAAHSAVFGDDDDDVTIPPIQEGLEEVALPSDAHPWEYYGGLDNEDLALQSLGNLRKYATNVLKIVGGGRIPGGKAALLERIYDVRKE